MFNFRFPGFIADLGNSGRFDHFAKRIQTRVKLVTVAILLVKSEGVLSATKYLLITRRNEPPHASKHRADKNCNARIHVDQITSQNFA